MLFRLGVALACGLVIGLERGFRFRDQPSSERQAGLRTFALAGLGGGLAAALAAVSHDLVLAALALGMLGLIVAGYVMSQTHSKDAGLTTEVALGATFVLGAIAVRGDMLVAAASAVVIASLLGLKQPLQAFLGRLQTREVTAFLQLLVISVVLLPLLPNEGFGPGGALNPYELWWVVVVIAAVSLAGYAALRTAGPRAGPALMGAVGGIASSTAVAMATARLARDTPSLSSRLAGAAGLANGVMFLRTLAIAALIAPGLALPLAPGLLAAAAGMLIPAAVLLMRKDHATPALTLEPPGNLGPALKLAAALGAFAVLVALARIQFGEQAVLVLSAMSGLVDADATTVTMARAAVQAEGILPTAAAAIAISAGVNTLAKTAIAGVFGTPGLFRSMAMLAAISLGAGALGLGVSVASGLV